MGGESRGGNILDNVKYTGLGLGTYIVLLLLTTFVFWYLRNKISGQLPADQAATAITVLKMAQYFLQILMFAMAVNAFFLKAQGMDDKIFRIGMGRKNRRASDRAERLQRQHELKMAKIQQANKAAPVPKEEA